MDDSKKKVHDIRTGTEVDEEEISPDEEESRKNREQINRWIRGSKKRTV